MTLKLEECELLAALLTAQIEHITKDRVVVVPAIAHAWRLTYQDVLREFIELNKAEEPK